MVSICAEQGSEESSSSDSAQPFEEDARSSKGTALLKSRLRKHWKLYSLIAVALAVLIIAFDMSPSPISTMAKWNVKQVPDVSSAYRIDSTIDAKGNLHLVCNSDYQLTYAVCVDNSWTVSRHPTVFPSSSSIAVDTEGGVHIAAIDRFDYTLYYITDPLGSWETETVATEVWKSSAICLDSDGNVHIGYFINYTICYATNSEGTWNTWELFHTSYRSQNIDILADHQSVIHLFAGQDLRHVTIENGTSRSEFVCDMDDFGESISATLDSQGYPHVAFYGGVSSFDSGDWGLRHGVNESGSWVVTLVDSIEDTRSGHCSIDVDSQDGIHICYLDYADQRQKYATNAEGEWAIQSLTKSGISRGRNSLVVDQEDDIHTFFYVYRFRGYTSSDTDLVHATDGFPPMILRYALYAFGVTAAIVLIAYGIGLVRKRSRERMENADGPLS